MSNLGTLFSRLLSPVSSPTPAARGPGDEGGDASDNDGILIRHNIDEHSAVHIDKPWAHGSYDVNGASIGASMASPKEPLDQPIELDNADRFDHTVEYLPNDSVPTPAYLMHNRIFPRLKYVHLHDSTVAYPEFKTFQGPEFKFGRVFAVSLPNMTRLNHTGFFEDSVQTTRSGYDLYTSIRWFVAIESAENHCIGLPILTYGGVELLPLRTQKYHQYHGRILAGPLRALEYDEGLTLRPVMMSLDQPTHHSPKNRSFINYSRPYHLDVNNMVVYFAGSILQRHQQQFLHNYKSSPNPLPAGTYFHMNFLTDEISNIFCHPLKGPLPSALPTGKEALASPSTLECIESDQLPSPSVILNRNPHQSGESTVAVDSTERLYLARLVASSIVSMSEDLTQQKLSRQMPQRELIQVNPTSSLLDFTALFTDAIEKSRKPVNALTTIDAPVTNIQLSTTTVVGASIFGAVTSSAVAATARSTILTNRETRRQGRAKLDVERRNLAIQQKVEADRVEDRKRRLKKEEEEDLSKSELQRSLQGSYNRGAGDEVRIERSNSVPTSTNLENQLPQSLSRPISKSSHLPEFQPSANASQIYSSSSIGQPSAPATNNESFETGSVIEGAEIPSLESLQKLQQQLDRIKRYQQQTEYAKTRERQKKMENIKKLKGALKPTLRTDEGILDRNLRLLRQQAENNRASASQSKTSTESVTQSGDPSSTDNTIDHQADRVGAVPPCNEDSDASDLDDEQIMKMDALHESTSVNDGRDQINATKDGQLCQANPDDEVSQSSTGTDPGDSNRED